MTGDSYDHRSKAGNPGDVVKHVALTACLDLLTPGRPPRPFLYADAFAGFPSSPADGPAWADGVGSLDASKLRNPHARLWWDRFAQGRSSYPGSTVIAAEILTSARADFRLAMWDTSPAAVVALRGRFADVNAVVHARPAREDDEQIARADLLLIDPPGLDRPGWPSWEQIRRLPARCEGAVLVWLPVLAELGGGSAEPPSPPADLPEGFAALRVELPRSGRLIGCDLLVRLEAEAADAVRSAVADVQRAWGT